ncbi:MAG: hypothetical protein ACHQ51_06195 [Elusimicrobiota bacterium]
MRRWVAAVVAVLFLSTATLHVFAHVGDSDGGCATCHVQQAGGVQAAAPKVAVASTIEIALPSFVVSRTVPARTSAVPARAPPSRPA